MPDHNRNSTRDDNRIMEHCGRRDWIVGRAYGLKWLAQVSVFSLLALLTPPQLFSQGALGPVDHYHLSPYDLNRVVPGTMAPDFRLQDQDGKVHQLSRYRGKNVVLVLYRGYW